MINWTLKKKKSSQKTLFLFIYLFIFWSPKGLINTNTRFYKFIISLAISMALGVAMVFCQSLGKAAWSRLKYFSNY